MPKYNIPKIQEENISGGGFQDYRTDIQKGLNINFNRNNKNSKKDTILLSNQ